ncbi:Alginate_exp domain-containing protein [Rubrivivax sp. A210]|uniref:alginate export family protein n=1 Tax=Rubrivivax sp. A210 TaxID=2772301 RepID=UPI0019188E7D|nr:alginate export family protein [Rubrivivax sp. A210]CAD5373925.1 Alginate_exp domain-containing protein [Rubrivivax sp. A210]
MLRRCLLLTLSVLAASALAQTPPPEPELGTPAPRTVSQRPDERRAEQPSTVQLFGVPVELGMSYEGSVEGRRNYDLNRARNRDRDVASHELKLDARWKTDADTTWFVQGVGLSDRRRSRSDRSVTKQESAERGQTWVMWERLGEYPLSIQMGRIALVDRRSWWWDDDLDAIRLVYAPDNWRLETGVARELARVSSASHDMDADKKAVKRWFGNFNLRWAPRHSVEAFWLFTDDDSGPPKPGSLFAEDEEDASDGRLRWLGLRSSGEVRFESKNRWTYRADAAMLRGREFVTAFSTTPEGLLSPGATSRRNVRGYAWDIGTQWVLPSAARPTFSLGLAQGSGAPGTATLERGFRQTGLHENKGRVGGVKRLRFYGELLDPELSNLRVASAGFGFRFLSSTSAEVIVHRYRQMFADTRIANSRLSQDPQGLSRDIGREIDVLFAMREWRQFEVTLLLTRFYPGQAFAENRRDPAHGIELGVALNF